MILSAPEVVLRPSVAGDVDELAGLWHLGWREAHLGRVPITLLTHRRPMDFRRRMFAHLDRSTTAIAGDRLAGFVTTREDELEQLYVNAPFRGSGVASALLSACERKISVRFPIAWLAVVEGNSRAQAFYRRRGWRDSGLFDHQAPTTDGDTVAIPALRYEKTVAPAPKDDL